MANDASADSDPATVSITVNAVDDPPIALDDSASTDEDTPVVISVLANDTDADGDPLTVTDLSDPARARSSQPRTGRSPTLRI